MHENEISGIILDASIKVHNAMKPGLLESVYEEVLAYELRKRGLKVERQKPLPVFYEDKERNLSIIRNYLGLSGKKLAILVNFNADLIKGNFHRIVNNL